MNDRYAIEIEAIQKAILWSGSALVVGALLGFGLGVRVARRRETT